MSAVIDIEPGERGRIRVFAVNRPPDEMRAMLARAPASDVARDLLSAPHLDTRTAEIFPMRDLAGAGLSGYLAEGYAVPETVLADDRARLDALEGYVLLLFSDSFGGSGGHIEPGADLTLIGAYDEYLPDDTSRPIVTPSAAPYSGAPAMIPPAPVRGPAARAMVILALVAAAGLLVWWLFLGAAG